MNTMLGLTDLSTEELKKLLRHVHRGELSFPLTVEIITCVGFQYRYDVLMGVFRGLDEAGVRAALVCTLAERLNAA